MQRVKDRDECRESGQRQGISKRDREWEGVSKERNRLRRGKMEE